MGVNRYGRDYIFDFKAIVKDGKKMHLDLRIRGSDPHAKVSQYIYAFFSARILTNEHDT